LISVEKDGQIRMIDYRGKDGKVNGSCILLMCR